MVWPEDRAMLRSNPSAAPGANTGRGGFVTPGFLSPFIFNSKTSMLSVSSPRPGWHQAINLLCLADPLLNARTIISIGRPLSDDQQEHGHARTVCLSTDDPLEVPTSSSASSAASSPSSWVTLLVFHSATGKAYPCRDRRSVTGHSGIA